MELELGGGRALVTGGSGGIGRAVCRALAREGAAVAVSGRDPGRLEVSAAALRDQGAVASVLVADLERHEDADALVARAEEALGGELTMLVICHARLSQMAKVFSLAADDVRAGVGTDLEAAFTLTRRALPSMMGRRHGRVVFVGSASAQLGQGKAPLYCAIKAGLEGLARNLAIDFGKFGVTANVVAPGFVDTERLRRRAGSDEMIERLLDNVAAKRFADPAEIADAVAFLCSARAAYINGVVLPVTGGAHLMNLW